MSTIKNAKRASRRAAPRGSASQRRSIEFNSYLCKAVLGKEYRHVHEIMEGVRKPNGR